MLAHRTKIVALERSSGDGSIDASLGVCRENLHYFDIRPRGGCFAMRRVLWGSEKKLIRRTDRSRSR